MEPVLRDKVQKQAGALAVATRRRRYKAAWVSAEEAARARVEVEEPDRVPAGAKKKVAAGRKIKPKGNRRSNYARI